MEDQPKGQLFSRVYIPKGDPLPDSHRFRLRLACGVSDMFRPMSEYLESELGSIVQRELGVRVPRMRMSGDWDIGEFIATAEIRDVLDSISFVARLIRDRGLNAQLWTKFVGRVFAEENLHYRIDDLGGVHFLVDREFERNKNAVLICLGGKFPVVEESLNSAFSRLSREPFDTKAAVWDMFSAAESLVKTITNNSGQVLTDKFVETNIKPMVQRVYGKIDSATHSAAGKSISGFSQWVQSVHPYRHGQKDSKSTNPPLEITVLLLSQGASYIRWLVEVHNLNETGREKAGQKV